MVDTEYDLFITYAHADKAVVHKLVQQLRDQKVRIWIDKDGLKPGDSLRDSISRSLDSSKYQLVVLSPAAMSSNWVHYELNSGMILEIERTQTRVIAAIIGRMDFLDLPTDLRGKLCLDLRNDEVASRAFESLLNLIRPEIRERRELLANLRSGGMAPTLLRKFALQGHDQRVQIAAMRGLTKVDGAISLEVAAERLLNVWGSGAQKAAIGILKKAANEEAIIALSAFLLYFASMEYDVRIALRAVLDRAGLEHEVSFFDGWKSDHKQLFDLKDFSLHTSVLELRHGLVIASLIGGLWSHLERPPSYDDQQIGDAITYTSKGHPWLVRALTPRTWDIDPNRNGRRRNFVTHARNAGVPLNPVVGD
jgi:hypothetical protein